MSRTMCNVFHRTAGFTLLEAATTIMVIALVAVSLVTIASNVLNARQADMTTERMNELRRAINGNPVIVLNESRTSFGYLGDMGNLPAKLDDLWVKGAQLAFAFNTVKKTGAGWNGPYLELTAAEFAAALALDGWGNTFSYSTSSFSDGTFGATALGKLVSLGPDLSAGGNDDMTINFFQAEVVSRVQGYVRDNNGNSVAGVGMTINYPQNGVLTSQTALADDTGYYSFTNIPFGNRSITIEPKLVLAPDTVVVSGVTNENVKFTVKNFAGANTSITSIRVDYTINPPAYVEQLKVGGTTVYDSNNPRLATGSTVAFAAKTVTGTGLVAESIPIRLQSPVTDVADLAVGDIGKGGSLVIEMNKFNDAQTGAGNAVDILGVNFQITFSDGSVVVVKP